MSKVPDITLTDQATEISSETESGANSAPRIGAMLQNLIDSKGSRLDPISTGSYSTVLTFDDDYDIYHDATGASITFTLGSGNIDGKGIFLRLNKPTSVTFPGTFEADANSQAVDATKLNVFLLIFFSNWNGSGQDHVIYKNSLFNSL